MVGAIPIAPGEVQRALDLPARDILFDCAAGPVFSDELFSLPPAQLICYVIQYGQKS